MIRNIIPEFTKSELEYILTEANFTKEEKTLFSLRNDEYSMEQCVEMMNMSESTLYRINKKMKRKIFKILANNT